MRDIVMLDENAKPFSRTYKRRAGNLVRHGRAVWVDADTIRVVDAGSPDEMEAESMAEDAVVSEESLGNPKIRIGDVVRLNSGGPTMTVVGRLKDGSYLCRWWNSDKQAYSQDGFLAETLKQAK